MVGLQPDIILTGGAATTAAVQRETRTIPIVVAAIADPVPLGIVARLDRPGGNTQHDKTDSRLASKGRDGRIDFCVAM